MECEKMPMNTLFQCSQEERPLHDFLLTLAIFRPLGAHPPFPDWKPETKVPKRAGGKEKNWRSLIPQSVEQTLGDAYPICGAIWVLSSSFIEAVLYFIWILHVWKGNIFWAWESETSAWSTNDLDGSFLKHREAPRMRFDVCSVIALGCQVMAFLDVLVLILLMPQT